MKSLFHLYLVGSGWGRPASSICSFHPVGSGWTKPQRMMEFLLPFAPRRVRLGETCFHQYAHFTPCRARLDETLREDEVPLPIVPRRVRLGETVFINMLISPRRVRLDETLRNYEVPLPFCTPQGQAGGDHFHQYAHFTPKGRAGRNLKS